MKKEKPLHPNLIPLIDIRGYISKTTGTTVSKYALHQWLRNGEISIFRPFGQRRKFATKTEVDRFIERHTKEEDKIESELEVYLK